MLKIPFQFFWNIQNVVLSSKQSACFADFSILTKIAVPDLTHFHGWFFWLSFSNVENTLPILLKHSKCCSFIKTISLKQKQHVLRTFQFWPKSLYPDLTGVAILLVDFFGWFFEMLKIPFQFFWNIQNVVLSSKTISMFCGLFNFDQNRCIRPFCWWIFLVEFFKCWKYPSNSSETFKMLFFHQNNQFEAKTACFADFSILTKIAVSGPYRRGHFVGWFFWLSFSNVENTLPILLKHSKCCSFIKTISLKQKQHVLRTFQFWPKSLYPDLTGVAIFFDFFAWFFEMLKIPFQFFWNIQNVVLSPKQSACFAEFSILTKIAVPDLTHFHGWFFWLSFLKCWKYPSNSSETFKMLFFHQNNQFEAKTACFADFSILTKIAVSGPYRRGHFFGWFFEMLKIPFQFFWNIQNVVLSSKQSACFADFSILTKIAVSGPYRRGHFVGWFFWLIFWNVENTLPILLKHSKCCSFIKTISLKQKQHVLLTFQFWPKSLYPDLTGVAILLVDFFGWFFEMLKIPFQFFWNIQNVVLSSKQSVWSKISMFCGLFNFDQNRCIRTLPAWPVDFFGWVFQMLKIPFQFFWNIQNLFFHQNNQFEAKTCFADFSILTKIAVSGPYRRGHFVSWFFWLIFWNVENTLPILLKHSKCCSFIKTISMFCGLFNFDQNRCIRTLPAWPFCWLIFFWEMLKIPFQFFWNIQNVVLSSKQSVWSKNSMFCGLFNFDQNRCIRTLPAWPFCWLIFLVDFLKCWKYPSNSSETFKMLFFHQNNQFEAKTACFADFSILTKIAVSGPYRRGHFVGWFFWLIFWNVENTLPILLKHSKCCSFIKTKNNQHVLRTFQFWPKSLYPDLTGVAIFLVDFLKCWKYPSNSSETFKMLFFHQNNQFEAKTACFADFSILTKIAVSGPYRRGHFVGWFFWLSFSNVENTLPILLKHSKCCSFIKTISLKQKQHVLRTFQFWPKSLYPDLTGVAILLVDFFGWFFEMLKIPFQFFWNIQNVVLSSKQSACFADFSVLTKIAVSGTYRRGHFFAWFFEMLKIPFQFFWNIQNVVLSPKQSACFAEFSILTKIAVPDLTHFHGWFFWLSFLKCWKYPSNSTETFKMLFFHQNNQFEAKAACFADFSILTKIAVSGPYRRGHFVSWFFWLIFWNVENTLPILLKHSKCCSFIKTIISMFCGLFNFDQNRCIRTLPAWPFSWLIFLVDFLKCWKYPSNSSETFKMLFFHQNNQFEAKAACFADFSILTKIAVSGPYRRGHFVGWFFWLIFWNVENTLPILLKHSKCCSFIKTISLKQKQHVLRTFQFWPKSLYPDLTGVAILLVDFFGWVFQMLKIPFQFFWNIQNVVLSSKQSACFADFSVLIFLLENCCKLTGVAIFLPDLDFLVEMLKIPFQFSETFKILFFHQSVWKSACFADFSILTKIAVPDLTHFVGWFFWLSFLKCWKYPSNSSETFKMLFFHQNNQFEAKTACFADFSILTKIAVSGPYRRGHFVSWFFWLIFWNVENTLPILLKHSKCCSFIKVWTISMFCGLFNFDQNRCIRTLPAWIFLVDFLKCWKYPSNSSETFKMLFFHQNNQFEAKTACFADFSILTKIAVSGPYRRGHFVGWFFWLSFWNVENTLPILLKHSKCCSFIKTISLKQKQHVLRTFQFWPKSLYPDLTGVAILLVDFFGWFFEMLKIPFQFFWNIQNVVLSSKQSACFADFSILTKIAVSGPYRRGHFVSWFFWLIFWNVENTLPILLKHSKCCSFIKTISMFCGLFNFDQNRCIRTLPAWPFCWLIFLVDFLKCWKYPSNSSETFKMLFFHQNNQFEAKTACFADFSILTKIAVSGPYRRGHFVSWFFWLIFWNVENTLPILLKHSKFCSFIKTISMFCGLFNFDQNRCIRTLPAWPFCWLIFLVEFFKCWKYPSNSSETFKMLFFHQNNQFEAKTACFADFSILTKIAVSGPYRRGHFVGWFFWLSFSNVENALPILLKHSKCCSFIKTISLKQKQHVLRTFQFWPKSLYPDLTGVAILLVDFFGWFFEMLKIPFQFFWNIQNVVLSSKQSACFADFSILTKIAVSGPYRRGHFFAWFFEMLKIPFQFFWNIQNVVLSPKQSACFAEFSILTKIAVPDLTHFHGWFFWLSFLKCWKYPSNSSETFKMLFFHQNNQFEAKAACFADFSILTKIAVSGPYRRGHFVSWFFWLIFWNVENTLPILLKHSKCCSFIKTISLKQKQHVLRTFQFWPKSLYPDLTHFHGWFFWLSFLKCWKYPSNSSETFKILFFHQNNQFEAKTACFADFSILTKIAVSGPYRRGHFVSWFFWLIFWNVENTLPILLKHSKCCSFIKTISMFCGLFNFDQNRCPGLPPFC